MPQFRQPNEGNSGNKKVFITCAVVAAIGLVLVAAVGAILAALLMPALSKARLEARFAADMSNLHNIGLAVETYRQEYDGHYPPSLAHLTEADYLSPEVLVSPADENPPAVDGVKTSYVYVGTPLPQNVPPDMPIAYTRAGVFPKRQAVLCADNSIRKAERARMAATLQDDPQEDRYPIIEQLNESLTEERKEELREFLDGIEGEVGPSFGR
jgi:type II secretory pathway pseudopilin PulG